MPPAWETTPAQDHGAVVPSDVTVFSPPFRSLFIGGPGTVTIISQKGNSATYTVTATGVTLSVAGKKVMATGTTATLIVALY